MTRAVIVSAVRTGIGRHRGQYAETPEEYMGSVAIKEAVVRSGVDPILIEDCIVGNLFGRNGNIGRLAYLTAELPVTTGGVSVDRQCGSGSAAIQFATAMIQSGMGEIFIVAGVENMTRSPYQLEKMPAYYWGPPKFLPSIQAPDGITMPETAEKVGALYGVTREECDQWAVISHKRATEATAKGLFKDEKVAIPVKTKQGIVNITRDEAIRPDCNLKTLAGLPTLVKQGGLVTAGNTCPRADGAAAMVIMSETRAKKLGIEPLAYVRACSVAGLDPDIMSYGPVPASEKVLRQTGLTVDDIDCWEINEAFAPQLIPCIRNLGIDPERVNPNGGAIAMGHPLGATGIVLATKLIYEMIRKDYHLGIVTMCIGGGQGMAVIYERC